LPPPSDGDADMRSPCFPSNGCGRKRDVQSIKFLIVPGIEALYGDETMKASLARSRSWSAFAPAGMPCLASLSPSYSGTSKSRIDARSTFAPNSRATRAASAASFRLSDSFRSAAAKTRTFSGGDNDGVLMISSSVASSSTGFQDSVGATFTDYAPA
jgi:hypothetical protein